MKSDKLKTRKIRVLVNGLHAKSGGGVTYLRNILSHLADDDRLELHLFLHEDQLSLFEPIDERVQRRVFSFPSGFWYLMLWEQISLPVIARKMAADVTFSPANYGPLLAPTPVIMLRNALAVGSDETRPTKRLYWAGLAMMTALSLISSRRAIAVSQYARDSLSFGPRQRLRNKVSVVYHGVNPIFSPGEKSADSASYLLVVADIYIQKNLHTLVEALAEIRRQRPHIRLKIAGRRNDESYYDQLVKTIARLGLEDSVDFLGQRSEDELVRLYRDCSLFVLPSTVETFGNPLAEAMASGVPVATSNAAAMPEIVADGAILFDPLDAQDMASKILQVLDDPVLATDIARRGRQRSEEFSWVKTARETANVLVAAAGERRPVARREGGATNVLINALSARRGGIVTYTNTLIAELRARHVDATIALPLANPDQDVDHTLVFDVRDLGAFRRFVWEQRAWRAVVKGQSPDVLFSSANFGLFRSPVPQLLMMSEGGIFNPLYLKHVMPRLGFWVRVVSLVRRFMMIRSIRAAPVVMLPTETLYQWILAYCPQLKGRAVVNSYGIDLDRFVPQPIDALAADGPVRLLYVSVYYPHKDPETLNQAVALLRNEGIDATAHITMTKEEFQHWPCGDADYESLVNGQKAGRITLAPVPHRDLPTTYGKNDIFIFPSVSETFGFPLVEAMACGLPVIAADTLTNREICGPAALYFLPYDAQALANRVKELRADTDLYRSIQAAGIARAQERFDLSDHFDRLVGVLEQMGPHNPVRPP